MWNQIVIYLGVWPLLKNKICFPTKIMFKVTLAFDAFAFAFRQRKWQASWRISTDEASEQL